MCGWNFAVIKPYGKLLRYLVNLSEEDRLYVFNKLAAAGYAKPGYEDLVGDLSYNNLMELGIEPQSLRIGLLKAFALSGKLLLMHRAHIQHACSTTSS